MLWDNVRKEEQSMAGTVCYQLYMGEMRNEVLYLGYPLALTPIEYQILRKLVERQDGVPISDLLVMRQGKSISQATLTVHICRINQKAAVIGERKMIMLESGKYYLNPLM